LQFNLFFKFNLIFKFKMATQILIDSAPLSQFSPRAPVAPSCEKSPNCSLFGSFIVSDLFLPANDLAALFRASNRTKRAAVLVRRAPAKTNGGCDVFVCKGAVPVRRIGSIQLPWLAELLDELLVTGHIDITLSPPSSPSSSFSSSSSSSSPSFPAITAAAAAAATPIYSYQLLLRAFTFGSLPALAQFFRCKSDLFRQQCWLQLAAVCKMPSSSVRVGCGVVGGVVGGVVVGGNAVGVPTTPTTTTTTTTTPTTTRIIKKRIEGAISMQQEQEQEPMLLPTAHDVVLGVLDNTDDNDDKKKKYKNNNNTDNCRRDENVVATQGIPCHGVGAAAKPIDCRSSVVDHPHATTTTTTVCGKRKAEVGAVCEPVPVVVATPVAAAPTTMFTTRLPVSAGSSSTSGNLKQVTINGVPLVATSFSSSSSLLSNIASMPKPDFVRPLARTPKAKQQQIPKQTCTTTATPMLADEPQQQEQRVSKLRRVGECADDSAAALLVALSAVPMAN
jgi:hypothetical protein